MLSSMGEPRKRLTPQDWIVAGIAMVADRGFDGVAVEPLARRVGATKGSFYWHFSDLPAFLRALLDHWHTSQTTQVIDEIDALPAGDRLPALLQHSAEPGGAATTLAIMAAAAHPDVGRIVRQVQHQRIAFLEQLFIERGLSGDQARGRARISYSAYLGNLVLSSTASRSERRLTMESDLAELLHMLDS